MSGPDDFEQQQPAPESRFLRRLRGPMLIAYLFFAVISPIAVVVPFTFAGDGRFAWAVVFGVFAVIFVAFLILAPRLGYRIDEVGIASREGIPPQYSETTRWDAVRIITWNAAPIRGTADNCTIWATEGGHRSKRLRWLLEAQTVPASLSVVRRHEATHGTLEPMLITLSHLSHRSRRHLIEAFEREGFHPIPSMRSHYSSTVSYSRPRR